MRKWFSVSYNDLYYGISHVKVPARGEVLSRYPLIILDGAHNQAGMKSLADIISKTNCNNCIAVIGMIEDKNVKEPLKKFRRMFLSLSALMIFLLRLSQQMSL